MTAAAPWEMPSEGAAAAIAARLAAAVPAIETPRLRLRAPRIADFGAYAAIATTERAAYIGGPMTRGEAWLDFNQMVAGWLLRGHGVWSVARRDDGVLLGFLPLAHEFGDPEPELGFLFVAAAEGQGYAREAAEAARAFAFDELGWDSVVSYVDPANARSVRLAERLGAVPGPETPEGVRVFRHLRPERRA